MSDLLILNPNTNDALTKCLVQKARKLWREGDVRGITASIGAPYISCRVSHAIAEYAVLDAVANVEVQPDDKILLACFGDPAVKAVRELVDVPVMGMAYAALSGCKRESSSIGIVTGGAPWKSMIEEFVRCEKFHEIVMGVEVTKDSGGSALKEKERAIHAVVESSKKLIAQGADTILVAGAGFSDLRVSVQERLSVPVYCSFEESVKYFNKHQGDFIKDNEHIFEAHNVSLKFKKMISKEI